MAKLKPGYTINEAGEVVSAAALVQASPFPPTPALVADVAAALTEEAQIEVVRVEVRACNACGGAVHPNRERCLACQVRYGAVPRTEVLLEEATDLETLTLTQHQEEEALAHEQEAIRQQMLVPLAEQLTPGEQRAKKKEGAIVPVSALPVAPHFRISNGQYLPPAGNCFDRLKAREGEYLPPILPLFGESVSQTIERELAIEAATIEGEIVHRTLSTDELIGGEAYPVPEEPVKGRRAKEQKLVSVTTALLPADKERLQARAEQHGMKIGPYVRSLLETCLGGSSAG